MSVFGQIYYKGQTMGDKYSRIEKFFAACDELVNGAYSMAETNIAGVLRAIAASGELTDFFTAATDGFDYGAAKRAYLRYPAERGGAHGIAYLPHERKDVLAFVFCVLVELDAGVMKTGDFLLRYFYKDGSFTASYEVFADRMIRPFRDIVRDCFPDSGRKTYLDRVEKKQDKIMEQLSKACADERTRISAVSLRDEEREAAEKIFPELLAAVGRKDAEEIAAVLAGYRYFLRYINEENEESQKLFALADEL